MPLFRRSPALLPALTLVLLGSGAPAADQPAFRTGVNFVRVDAFATVNGAPVRDLTANDFEVSEDGAPQKVETFERVEARGRLFVFFLDTYNMQVPVKTSVRTENGITWASAEVALAPLAPGDYLIRLTSAAGARRYEVLAGFRMVP